MKYNQAVRMASRVTWLSLLTMAAAVATVGGQTDSVLAPGDGEVLQLRGFGAELTPSLLPPLWDAEGLYVANHSARLRQWRHADRPRLLLAYTPINAGATAPRRWHVLDLGPDEDRLDGGATVAEFPNAGRRPWAARQPDSSAGWEVRDCTGSARTTAVRLSAVVDLRRQGNCGTLAWRLTGLGDRHPSLAPFAGLYRATHQYSAGAPVYRARSGAVLRRAVSGTRSSWVLGAADTGDAQLAVLDDFADRVNLIDSDRFVAAALPGQEFRDRPAFLCAPDGWVSGDADFQLPDLDGYTISATPAGGRLQWQRRPPDDADSQRYQQAFGTPPSAHARVISVQTDGSEEDNTAARAELESPLIHLTSDGCALLRLRNDGFRLTVLLAHEDGSTQQLLRRSSASDWHDMAVSLPNSGHLVLHADRSAAGASRLALAHVLVFNRTCHQLRGRTSGCDEATCLNGGTCASVTLKHHLCLCRPGYLGGRCERRVDCGEPPGVDGATVLHRSGSGYLDRVYYECLPGRSPSDTVLGLAWSSCHHNGSWVNVPRCEADDGPPQPHIACNFTAGCAGFNTDVDNFFNTDTDETWQRVDRLKTSDVRGEGDFLAVYRSRGRRRLTARLLTPCLDLRAPGCLRLDFLLTNAKLQLLEWKSGRTIFRTSEGGRGRLVALKARMEPLLIVVQLGEGESEAALDSVSVYRHGCDLLTKVSGGADARVWPTWPPVTPAQGQQGPSNNTAGPSAGGAATAGNQHGAIVLLVIPLLITGLVVVLCRPKAK